MNATVPINAWAVFPVGKQQVSGIPQIAYEIPDFEGSVRIQLFANSSQSEIACFQAVMRNGASFSQPAAVSSILGIFTVVAIIASFAAAAYGVSIPHMRTHYAHSFSVLIIFETFQSIFFSGALSLQWPSVLPAWWSNFAWSAGLIPVSNMVGSVNKFAGIGGNGSQVGGAGSTIINNNGGLIQQIYGRSLDRAADLATEFVPLVKRQPYDSDDPYDYNWGGSPITPGMPTPGDWSGFGGTLSELDIPVPDAFMLAFLWLIIALSIITGLIVVLKFSLERLAKLQWIQQDRLEFFRNNWAKYLRATLLRTLFIAFFSIMVLSLYQFNLQDRAGPVAIAAIVFLLFFIGVGGIAVYALQCRLRSATFASEPDRILFFATTILWYIPWFSLVRLSQLRGKEFDLKPNGSLPFVHWHFVYNGGVGEKSAARTQVHEDETYIKRFGWLSARYRSSRWWYFVFWLAYQFVRALFIGAAAQSPVAQVFGLFIVDIVAMVAIAAVNPYEGQRNTAVAVWILGFVKIATTGLSIAFLPELALNRMVATAVGVIIIVIQALLVIAVLVLVILGGISSWMSLYRNREYFSSERLEGTRIRYYEHIARRALDKVALPVEKKQKIKKNSSNDKAAHEEEKGIPQTPSEPYFSVRSVRRMAKIEDEDEDNLSEMESSTYYNTNTTTTINVYNINDDPINAVPRPPPLLPRRASRAGSLSSRHSVSSLPRAARVHRASWSSRDFLAADLERPDTARANRHSRSFSASTVAARFNPSATMGGGGAAAAASLRNQGSFASLRAGGGGNSSSFCQPVMPVQEDTAEDPDLHVGGHLDEHMFRKNLDHWIAGEEDRASQRSEEQALNGMLEKPSG